MTLHPPQRSMRREAACGAVPPVTARRGGEPCAPTGTSLRTYLLTRLALAIPTVLILLTMVFLLMRVAPGNPIQAALGGHVSQAEIEARSKARDTTGRS